MTTAGKVVIGIATLAVAGGIGYAIYISTQKKKESGIGSGGGSGGGSVPTTDKAGVGKLKTI